MSTNHRNGGTEVARKSDLHDMEMIFGTANSPKIVLDGHHITNERRHANHVSPNHNDVRRTNVASPLLEPDRGQQKPPLAGPEVDDLEDMKPTDAAPFPGIDDGLLDNGDTRPKHDPEHPHPDSEDVDPELNPSTHDDGVNTEDGKWPWDGGDETDYPYDGGHGLGPRFGGDSRPVSPFGPSVIDVNTYQQKKNLAQGMMDLALLSANANQLRYVLESSTSHPYYYTSLVFISLSIIFQIAVGVGLIMNSQYDVNDKKEICKADRINNLTVLGIFLITIVNVFITSFSVATPTTTLPIAANP